MIWCVLYWHKAETRLRLGSVEFHIPPRIGETIHAGWRQDEFAEAAGMENALDAMAWRIDDIRHNVGDGTVSVYVVPIATVTE